MNKIKIIAVMVILMFSMVCTSACLFEDKNKDNMIIDSYNITSITIKDNRVGVNASVVITDNERIKIIKDAFSRIDGTKMKTVFKGYPTMGYVYDFPAPIFLLTLKVTIADNSYFTYDIYCGQKIVVYDEYASTTPTGYTYDYKYVAKEDNQSGCYENKKDGLPLDFFLQFFSK